MSGEPIYAIVFEVWGFDNSSIQYPQHPNEPTMMTTTDFSADLNTVLILGARGRFGLATARAFADAGWRVLASMFPWFHVPGTPAAIAVPAGLPFR